MKNSLLLLWSVFILLSCGAGKPWAPQKNKSLALRNLSSGYWGKNTHQVDEILQDAEKYLGIPYKYGGTSRAGLDCSGFLILVFQENNIHLPRLSKDQALQGKKIEIGNARPGDLVFFDTSGAGKVNHVGLIKEIKYKGEVTFIHASSSKGVMISSLNQSYWNKAFLFTRRVL